MVDDVGRLFVNTVKQRLLVQQRWFVRTVRNRYMIFNFKKGAILWIRKRI